MPKLIHKMVRHIFLHMGQRALKRFESQTENAFEINTETLRAILTRNAVTAFGHHHRFTATCDAINLEHHYAQGCALTEFGDYEAYVKRIMHGEANVLSADRVTSLAGSAGTTDQPKRIPRTKAAQRHHLRLVVLAEQAVIQRRLSNAGSMGRGINLMSLTSPTMAETSSVPIISGPSSGMDRVRRLIPHLWCSPIAAYEVEHPPTASYLHALFGLLDTEATYIQATFAHHLTGWIDDIQQHQASLINDIETGRLSSHLHLTELQRTQLQKTLVPNPVRAKQIKTALQAGSVGVIARLWPKLRYLRTVTTGSFATYASRLAELAGEQVIVHSGCHSSSEGIVGINLNTDGSNDYTLAIGAAYFEFLPVDEIDSYAQKTVGMNELSVGQAYEIVMTTQAGLYRYRLGDVVRITGFFNQAPTFEILYRRGTLLNLVGDKTSEWQTARALAQALDNSGIERRLLKDYTVAPITKDGSSRYVFFAELQSDARNSSFGSRHTELSQHLDHALCDANFYYKHNARATNRLFAAEVCFVKPGTFNRWLEQRRAQCGTSASQMKVPRTVQSLDDIRVFQESVI